MKVCKFGGSATAYASAIDNIKELALEKQRRVFVFSAIGKSRKNDSKITDLLIALSQRSDDKKIIKKIKDKFKKLLDRTNVQFDINRKIDLIIKKYNKTKDADFLVSRGEYLTAFIMSKFLSAAFIPAERIVYFRKNKINYKKIKEKLNFYLNKYKKIVIPGFYGVNKYRKIILFSRGGSDVSGAIFAKILAPCDYENWTDVDGVKEVNPIFAEGRTIEKMSYKQLRIMSDCDAKVVHKDCAKILDGKGIKLIVANIVKKSPLQTVVVDKAKQSFFVCCKMKRGRCKIVSSLGRIIVDKEEAKEKICEIYKKARR